MTLKELKARSTAAEMCLIAATEEACKIDIKNAFLDVLEKHVSQTTDIFRDRSSLELIKRTINAAIKEFKESK